MNPSSRKRILFLAHRVPFPPDKGDRIRTFHQLAHLSARHDVFLACFADGPADPNPAAFLRRRCMEVGVVRRRRAAGLLRAAGACLSGEPLSCAAYRDPRMTTLLEAWARSGPFDVVTAFSACMAPYALAVPARRRVLDLCDADSRKWLEYSERSLAGLASVYRLEGRRLCDFERACLHRFDATIVITDRERDSVDPRGRCATLAVVGNGVHAPEGGRPPIVADPVISFIGEMSYPPNAMGARWLAEEVWPQVRAEVPEARLMIVGRNPPRGVRRLGRRRGVEVTGAVPEVRPYLRSSRAVAAPLAIARGLQNKVLEAMASGRPVVATSAVCRGLRVQPGVDILMADEAEAFAARLVDLCSDIDLCERIAAAAGRAVTRHYRWDEVLTEYEGVILGPGAEAEARPAVSPTATPWAARSMTVPARRRRNLGSAAAAAGPIGVPIPA
jgi:sugar transferase (PEP-CTERM/EpsH1 system associated)